ncbi:MAG: hypothetical protein ACKO1M_02595 [Planctomycetota bacterium]
MDPLTLLLRWAHVLAAIVALGGLLFARFAFVPAAEELGAETADRLHAGVRRRWLPWVIGSITLLLGSGLANYILLMRRVKGAPELWGGDWMGQTGYHALFGVKFLLALIVFYLASGLVGRGAGTQWIRDARKQWLSVTIGLGVAVVLISGWMRQLHTGANDLPDPVKAYARTYLDDIESANAAGGRDEDDSARGGARSERAGGGARPVDSELKTDPEVKSDGQEAKEADGGAASEDREAAATPGGGEAAAR